MYLEDSGQFDFCQSLSLIYCVLKGYTAQFKICYVGFYGT